MLLRPVILLCTIILACCFSGCSEKSDPKIGSKVYVGKTGDTYRIFKDGEPLYIKGAAGEATQMELLRDIGGNTIRFYDTLQLQSNLDSAMKHGLSVIVDIPLPRYNEKYNVYASERIKNDIYKEVEFLVLKYKDHPALLYWMLGNEVLYPDSYFNSSAEEFISFYNSLIDLIHEIDSDHPVSTAVSSVSKKRIIKIATHSSELDFLSINIFGNLKRMQKELDKIKLIWNGPYLISEWGDEGPWEVKTTKWGSPIEPTSEKKAERIAERYTEQIKQLGDRCMGNLVFYWGRKHERTHTWFSLFDEKGRKSQMVYHLNDLFEQRETVSGEAPKIGYMLIDGKGAEENMVLKPGALLNAAIYYEADDCDRIEISWEILPEAWDHVRYDKEDKPDDLNHLITASYDNQAVIKTPDREGPYRLFCYVTHENGSFSSANTPFFVIKDN
ncbi:hypothetical protein [Robertkochia aurantiaca]|uniref:hypothetical protein n=1 Tax=Robertkochia aurantiaca TaxID=2873700 RepID=UPI001CCB0EEC|nr:hypothetical protein [Robertkochia sp. 3YJGBD-33]